MIVSLLTAHREERARQTTREGDSADLLAPPATNRLRPRTQMLRAFWRRLVDHFPSGAAPLQNLISMSACFDRITGQPVWAIEERPVPQSDVPGEKTSPTQPHPTKPPAYGRNHVREPDDLIDFTPALRAQALENLKRYKYSPSPFTPAIFGNTNGLLGHCCGGSTVTNWPGGGFDPETGIVYAPAGNTASGERSVVAPPQGFSDIR